MNLAERTYSFQQLGEVLRGYHEERSSLRLDIMAEAAVAANASNPWFTPGHIRIALNNLGNALAGEELHRWLSIYAARIESLPAARQIGVVMAGNIPAVGFHDFMCVLLSGHRVKAKLSASDDKLIPAIAEVLIRLNPAWKDQITFAGRTLAEFDAIIATGSNNTSRYFEHYFSKYPNVIRKNRTSIAVLDGLENDLELKGLADDIMLFFGMGCRNISSIFVPEGYDFSRLLTCFNAYGEYTHHNKYRNNYDYYRSVMMVSGKPFIDAGVLLLYENTALASPIAMLHFQHYASLEKVDQYILDNSNSIQCVVSRVPLKVVAIRPGEAQRPALKDYADGVDTMEFLLSLK